MNNERYYAEYQPIWRKVDKYPPPVNTKILLRSKHGTALIGRYYEEGQFTHWAGLPKLDPNEKLVDRTLRRSNAEAETAD